MEPSTPTEDLIAALERHAYSRQGTADDLRRLAELHRIRDDERRRRAETAPVAPGMVHPQAGAADIGSTRPEFEAAFSPLLDAGTKDPIRFDATPPSGARRGWTLAAAGIGLGAVLGALSATTWNDAGEQSEVAPPSLASTPSASPVDAFARAAGPQDAPPHEVAVVVAALAVDAEVRLLGDADGMVEYGIRWIAGDQVEEMRISVEATRLATACTC